MKTKTLIFLLSGCILTLSILVIGQFFINRQTLSHSPALQLKVAELKAVARVDSVRLENIKRVLAVINRFNPRMPESVKTAIASEISAASMKYENLDIDLLCATITHESAFTWNPQVISPAGAMGLMQVMPATGKFLARIEGVEWTTAQETLLDPVISIRLGSRYLSSLIEIYEIDGGLAAYNGGGSMAARWIRMNKADGVLYEETQNYVPAVLSLYHEFRELN